jgi:hypothetical protein
MSEPGKIKIPAEAMLTLRKIIAKRPITVAEKFYRRGLAEALGVPKDWKLDDVRGEFVAPEKQEQGDG